jgi:inner membrane protein involved in colicin E2 resistance
VIKRTAGIVFIFACTGAAWGILGITIFTRTQSTDDRLRGRVASTWGAPQTQTPPTATYEERVPKTVESTEGGKRVLRTVEERVITPLPLERSTVEVALDLEHRQKGLLWYSTYKVAFSGSYTFRNTSGRDREVSLTFEFPAAQAIYDDLVIRVNGQPAAATNREKAVAATARVAAGQPVNLEVSYRSQGLDTWHYSFGGDVAQVRDFTLTMTTNFKDIDFPENTLSPAEKREAPGGWELVWRYNNLVTGYQLGLALPQKLQPGPFAGRVSFFAPVSLFFFFFFLFMFTTLRDIEVHPMNYFFLACAFFSFHLLLAYLVDRISVHTAFLICSAVSIFLVVTYLRLVVGWRFALVEAGLAQLVYLVLFSYSFFLEGYTGLVVTIGSILTLFAVMQMTGRIRWAEKFGRKPA